MTLPSSASKMIAVLSPWPRFDVAVEAVVRGVELAVVEPLEERRLAIRRATLVKGLFQLSSLAREARPEAFVVALGLGDQRCRRPPCRTRRRLGTDGLGRRVELGDVGRIGAGHADLLEGLNVVLFAAHYGRGSDDRLTLPRPHGRRAEPPHWTARLCCAVADGAQPAVMPAQAGIRGCGRAFDAARATSPGFRLAPESTSHFSAHTGGSLPSGTAGSVQHGGVCDNRPAWRTAVRRPKWRIALLRADRPRPRKPA